MTGKVRESHILGVCKVFLNSDWGLAVDEVLFWADRGGSWL
jgi:hypothetical protein